MKLYRYVIIVDLKERRVREIVEPTIENIMNLEYNEKRDLVLDCVFSPDGIDICLFLAYPEGMNPEELEQIAYEAISRIYGFIVEGPGYDPF